MSVLGPHDAGRISEKLRSLPLVGEGLGRVRVRDVEQILEVLDRVHNRLAEVDEELARLRAARDDSATGGIDGE